MLKLRKCQQEAVEQLIKKTRHLTIAAERKSILFVAPTGAGKTIVLAYFIKTFLLNQQFNDQKHAFLWLSPGKGGLERQSTNKINQILQTAGIKVADFNYFCHKGSLAKIDVVVINWEKVNRESNKFYQGNEYFDFQGLITNTKLEKNLIVIVDEEHYGKTKKAQEVINQFAPGLIIRTSATPDEKEKHDDVIKITWEEAVAEQLIKKSHKLNEMKKYFSISSQIKDKNEIFLESSLKKQKELKQLYQEAKSIVNPLIIVQLPDETNKLATELKHQAINFFEKNNITFTNQLLAIDLDKNKQNTANLAKKDGKQIVIITKQTITHGWDCPRAQILVKLRGKSGKKFNIQSLGRITRVPEIEKGYYKKDELNYGYVYTQDKNFWKDLDNREVSITRSLSFHMKQIWKQKLTPYQIKNQKNINFSDFVEEKNFELSLKFNNWFRKENNLVNIDAKSIKMKEFFSNHFQTINLKSTKTTLEIITGEIKDSLMTTEIKRKIITLNYKKDGLIQLEKHFKIDFCHFLENKLGKRDFIQEMFEFLFSMPFTQANKATEHLYDFQVQATNSLSERKLRTAYFYCFLLNSRKIWLNYLKKFYQNIAVQNKKISFNNLKDCQENFQFTTPKEYSLKITKSLLEKEEIEKLPTRNNNLYQNFIQPDVKNFSNPEIKFIRNFLESYGEGDKIDWWYRNTENENKSWKIIYVDKNKQYRNFYPDFIIQIQNQIWIIEVKDTSNLDQNNQEKFVFLKVFCQKNKLNFAFVAVDGEKVKFNNVDWSTNYADKKQWKTTEDFFANQS